MGKLKQVLVSSENPLEKTLAMLIELPPPGTVVAVVLYSAACFALGALLF